MSIRKALPRNRFVITNPERETITKEVTPEQKERNERRLRIEAHQAEIRAKQSEIWFD